MSTLQPRDSHVTDPSEIRRLTKQAEDVLRRLQQGPASARELSQIALKYTSRVSDLRKAGYDVRCNERGTYFLVKDFPRGHNVNAPTPGRMF